jgi:hypothetical protein
MPQQHACLRSRYLATAIVQLLTSRSLPSNGSTYLNLMKIIYFALYTNHLLVHALKSRSESESDLLYDWLFIANWDSRPVICFQLNTCGHSPYVTSTLTREWLFLLQLLLVLDIAVILGSEYRGTLLLCQSGDLPNLDGQFSVFIFPRNMGPSCTPFHP